MHEPVQTSVGKVSHVCRKHVDVLPPYCKQLMQMVTLTQNSPYDPYRASTAGDRYAPVPTTYLLVQKAPASSHTAPVRVQLNPYGLPGRWGLGDTGFWHRFVHTHVALWHSRGTHTASVKACTAMHHTCTNTHCVLSVLSAHPPALL